jgi:hypothetical protein
MISRESPESEITPEMIEAGVRILNRHTSDERRVLPDREIIRRIILAAAAAGDGPLSAAQQQSGAKTAKVRSAR